MTQNQLKNESGRSMLELLMVLGIITIISIAGMRSYKKVKYNNHANEIMETAGKLKAIALTKEKTVYSYTEKMPMPNNIEKIESTSLGIVTIYQNRSLPCDVMEIFKQNALDNIGFTNSDCTD